VHLVQILLPVQEVSLESYDALSNELTEKFGGVTAYSRAPAAGLWKETAGSTVQDDIVVYEVMVDNLDRAWWTAYRSRLEKVFAQQEVVIRAYEIERL
jgi:hypothetical protein